MGFSKSIKASSKSPTSLKESISFFMFASALYGLVPLNFELRKASSKLSFDATNLTFTPLGTFSTSVRIDSLCFHAGFFFAGI